MSFPFSRSHLVARSHPQPLASLSANKLQTDYAIFSDDTMAGTFCLESVVLIDERPGANNQFPVPALLHLIHTTNSNLFM
jgi:hypothetical protein